VPIADNIQNIDFVELTTTRKLLRHGLERKHPNADSRGFWRSLTGLDATGSLS